MNYLDLTNNVLRRMRENTVTAVYENVHSSLIADFVNDAKRICEEAHDWTAFRTDIIVPTVNGTSEYSITGSQGRATIIDVQNTTTAANLSKVPQSQIRKWSLVSQGNTSPSYYSMYGVDSAGDDKINLYPVPDAAYLINVHCVVRPDDLVAEGDELIIPHQPVIYYALAMAAQERGGVDGTDVQSYMGQAKRYLGNAIQYDMAKVSDESIWYPV